MTRIEEMEARIKAAFTLEKEYMKADGYDAEQVDRMMEAFDSLKKHAREDLPWALDIIKRMRPLLQRGFSGTKHSQDMAKCYPRLYDESHWPIPCGKCDICLTDAILAELKEGE